MHLVRRYPDRARAQIAVEYLLQHGIAARVLEEAPGPYQFTAADVQVVVLDRGVTARAAALLEEMGTLSVELERPLEEAARPDLSRLDPGLAAACPGCGARLPLDAAVEACGGCGAVVDIPELLALAHGPELLFGCYPEPPELPEEVLRQARVSCPGCQYDLSGLQPVGRCPECGKGYSKSWLLRGSGG